MLVMTGELYLRESDTVSEDITEGKDEGSEKTCGTAMEGYLGAGDVLRCSWAKSGATWLAGVLVSIQLASCQSASPIMAPFSLMTTVASNASWLHASICGKLLGPKGLANQPKVVLRHGGDTAGDGANINPSRWSAV